MLLNTNLNLVLLQQGEFMLMSTALLTLLPAPTPPPRSLIFLATGVNPKNLKKLQLLDNWQGVGFTIVSIQTLQTSPKPDMQILM